MKGHASFQDMLRMALANAVASGTEMDARDYIAGVTVTSVSVPEMVRHAKQLYPEELARLVPADYENVADHRAVLQEIVSILMTGYEDEHFYDEEEEEEEEEDEDEEYSPTSSSSSSYSEEFTSSSDDE